MIGKLKVVCAAIDRHKATFEILDGISDSGPVIDGINDLKRRGIGNLTITISEYRKKRSLNANGFMWAVCSAVADAAGVTKEEVYRRNLMDGNCYITCNLPATETDRFSAMWATNGIGWFIEALDYGAPGKKLVNAYYGSSQYDTKQMSDLIDRVLQDAESCGVHISTAQLQSLLDAWDERDK
jgi:hypothetical protein